MSLGGGSVLAQAIDVGRHRLRNRVIGAPMERNLSTSNGVVTTEYVDYLQARAAGGAALLFTEAAYVRADGKGRHRQMGIHDDDVIAPLSRLVDAVHRHNCLLGVELNHGGRTAQGVVSGMRCVAPSPVPCEVAGGEMPLQLESDEIEHLIASYAEAARRCVTAGVDVLSIHAAHGYLIHQFMSPRTNLRDDAWGDPGRFLGAVILAVRDAASDATIGMRISAIEGPRDGLDFDATFSLVARAPLEHLDFLDVSAGSYEAGEWIVQPGEWEEGILAPFAERYRQLGLPVSVAGRITRRETAEAIVSRRQADMVSVARALHADPRWAGAVTVGRRYRPCIACNLCIDELGTGRPVPCSVNPDVGREAHKLDGRALSGVRFVVVGGGPGGLEAARRSSLLGASVTLLEREPALGGQLRLASRLHEYPQYHRILDWYAEELDRLRVEIRCGVEASPADVLGFDPGAVVVATGGEGVLPAVSGIEQPRVVEVRSWLLAGAPELGSDRHIVWGADREGVAVADELVHRGRRVLIVGAQESLAPDVGRRAKILVVPRLLQHPGVQLCLEARVEEISEQEVVVARQEERRVFDGGGPILVSQGVTPRSGLVAALRSETTSLLVEVVGDAGGAGAYIGKAIESAARAVESIGTRIEALRRNAQEVDSRKYPQ